jgi:serine/threonine protein kinase/formylglycine-generating enzyme required for sulfatase activity
VLDDAAGERGEWTPPAEFDEYRLVRAIGRGAMGQVYLAHDRTLDREVALKFLALPPSDAALGRFLIEARAAARLQHPNVVTVHRIGTLDRRPFIVTEMLRGTGLDQVARPAPWRDVLAIGVDLARGLAAAHRAGILHRDLKPANAIRRDTGEVVLVDFGLAKVTGLDGSSASGAALPAFSGSTSNPQLDVTLPPVDNTDPLAATAMTPVPAEAQRTPTGKPPLADRSPSDAHIMGTPFYMAPEVLEGLGATASSDVYSLGVLLYELCAGRLPHTAGSLAGLIARKARDDAPPLASLVADCDPRLAAIIQRCLARDPHERFGSADELREALETIQAPRTVAKVEGNPYRGLLPFGPEHRGLFFGRARDTRAVLDRLRGERLVVVVGESGVGKSSLCKAAVAPAIEEGALGDGRRWTTITLTPGRRPAYTLGVALVAHLAISTALLDDFVEQPHAAVRRIQRALGPDRGLLIVLDQLEELVTLADAEESAAAAAMLAEIVSARVAVRIVASARGDLIAYLAAVPTLGPLIGRALHPLLPLDAAGVRESVVGPARVAGVEFADPAIVDELVAAAGRSEAGLPLLQFALAELWERCEMSGVITAEAVAALGGVEGALARHADRVLAGMLPDERAAARRVLVRLATARKTRARPGLGELVGGDPVTAAAIGRLVESRLLVAREQEGESTIEVAHEALFTGWPRLRDWLDEEGGAARMRERIASAAHDWQRDGRPREGLWGPRALLAAEAVPEAELDAASRQFLAAGRRARLRRRVAAVGLATVVAGAAAATWAVTRWQAGRDLDRGVTERLRDATATVEEARALRDRMRALQEEAYRAFDERRLADGEARWAEALALGPEVATAYGRASSNLEAALRLDAGRADVRRLLLEVLYERAVLAEADRQPTVRDELLARIAVYDDDGAMRARWSAPAQVRVAVAGAEVTVGDRVEATPTTLELPPGSHVLVFRAPGKAEVRLPLLLARGEELEVALELPAADAVPEGFVYVPPGRFRFGSSGDEARRSFFGTSPEHERTTGAFLIARHETTFAEWIEFLEALPEDERELRRPTVGVGGFRGRIDLKRERGGWLLTLVPTEQAYQFSSDQRFVYLDRKHNVEQDWLLFPVSGVSWRDAKAYVDWLRSSNQIAGARLCREDEWERAARGADSRLYAHGDLLEQDAANIDVTYDRKPRAFGPDQVGLHAASDSAFGVSDMVGNVFEFATPVLNGDAVARGGAYYFDAASAAVPNRQVIDPTTRDPTLGVRVCADP